MIVLNVVSTLDMNTYFNECLIINVCKTFYDADYSVNAYEGQKQGNRASETLNECSEEIMAPTRFLEFTPV